MLYTLIKELQQKVEGTKWFSEVMPVCYLGSVVYKVINLYILNTHYVLLVGQKLYLEYDE